MKNHLFRLSLAFCLTLALLGSLPASPVRAFAFTLTVQANIFGGGSGTVTASGIDCRINKDLSTSGDCTETYPINEIVTLSANPDPDSTFNFWGGDCNASGQVTMAMDRTCTADFGLTPIYHTVTVIGAGNGSGTVTGGPAGSYWVDCAITAGSASGDCSETFLSTTWAWLVANANPDSTFGGWSGDCEADGKVTLEADKTCIATFNLLDATPPTVLYITRDSADPTSAASVDFNVAFSEDVANVDASDFVLTTSGVSGAAIGGFSGSGNLYKVTVNTGAGNGTIGIAVPDGVDITDLAGNPLTGLPFLGGEIYTVQKIFTFRSEAGHDGWILESRETSGAGGSMNSAAATFYVGDDASDKQYRGFLSFNTSTLPPNAVITSVKLRIKLQGFTGTSPFATHGNLLVDVRKGAWGGNPLLQLADFKAPASRTAIGALSKTAGNWYAKTWASGIFDYINLTGFTQFRLRFATDDNDDMGADYARFYSGNASLASRPQLIIECYVP